ncbi:glycosyltransferase 87 family protein [Actinomadura rupiterrae]|uniref:glycosyltransferase 87 family protein n=1 Tax=Actinomadura rupiterrae TaxID=559627 RepID=UPI0020A377CF|nr:glycosyltransferase 87 family protein [Actinomadura rupiterrae]MCP2338032.1 alpha-1,2-mannosyltransferase [Actinomadura rupiterrae]
MRGATGTGDVAPERRASGSNGGAAVGATAVNEAAASGDDRARRRDRAGTTPRAGTAGTEPRGGGHGGTSVPSTGWRPRDGADWLILAAGILVAVAAITPIVVRWLGNPPDQRLVDLEVYREGGRAVLRQAKLYDVLTQPPQLLPFTYPPFPALLAVPFTLMSWTAAQWTWTALEYLALIVIVRYAFRDLIARTGRWAPLTFGVLFGACAWLTPAFDQIRFGQVGFFLMALCLADTMARTAYWPRGVLVGIAIAVKLVPGVFLIYFLLTGRRQAAANSLLTAAAASLFTFAWLPSDSVDYWFGALLQGGDRTGAVNGTTNQALNGWVSRITPEGPLRTALWGVLVIVVAYAGFRLARRATLAADRRALPALPPDPSRRWGTDRMLAADPAAGDAARSLLLAGVAVTGLLSVLLSPVGWIHHLVWIIAVVGALVGDGRNTRRCLVAAGVWLYYLFPVPWWGTHLTGPQHPLISQFFGQLIRDLFGFGAVALMFVLGIWLVNRLTAVPDHEDPSRPLDGVGTLTP